MVYSEYETGLSKPKLLGTILHSLPRLTNSLPPQHVGYLRGLSDTLSAAVASQLNFRDHSTSLNRARAAVTLLLSTPAPQMWITNGCRTHTELGDVFLVYARTAKAGGGDGYSLFLVEKGMPGFSLGSRVKDKLGMRASNTAEIVFDRVRIPAATHLVGTEGKRVCAWISMYVFFLHRAPFP